MSEIRKKLVIVGDGACGKVPYFANARATAAILTRPLDLFVDCIRQRKVSRGPFLQSLFYALIQKIGLCADGFRELGGGC